MLRIVRQGESAPRNDLLREALDRVTLGRPGQTEMFILDEAEAEVLYRVLAPRPFSQGQLDDWIERLREDHPYQRTRRETVSGLFTWIKWVVFGGEKPQSTTVTESAKKWIRRNGRYIDEQIASVDDPSWLQRPLQALVAVRREIARESGKSQWAVHVMRWALVQLLAPPLADTTSAQATG